MIRSTASQCRFDGLWEKRATSQTAFEMLDLVIGATHVQEQTAWRNDHSPSSSPSAPSKALQLTVVGKGEVQWTLERSMILPIDDT